MCTDENICQKENGHWDLPGVPLRQHDGFVVQEPLGLEVYGDERYLGEKKGRAWGAALGTTGTLSPR